MPLILVVEQEQRYVERIEEALGPQGWEVVGVDDHSAAMRLVADRAADLVVVNSEVAESAELVTRFARVNGGPGAVVLVPESDGGSVPDEADEVLRKPFTDQELSLAVRRCIAATRDVAEAEDELSPVSEERLSSEDIFGDVVLELEGAFNLGAAGAEEAGAVAEEPVASEPAVPPVVEETPPASIGVEEPVAPEEQVSEEIAAKGAVPAETVSDGPGESKAVAEAIDTAVEGLEMSAEAPAVEPEATAEIEPIEEEAVEQEVEEEPAAEEPAEAEPVEDEPVEVGVVDEETVEGQPTEEEAVEEEPVSEEEEVPEEAVDDAGEDEVAAAAEATPEKPAAKKKLLEERLHEALTEGKALSAKEDRPAAESADLSQSTDLLLQKALATLSADSRAAARIDDEFAAPAHATEEEVDDLVSTVIGRKKKAVEPPQPTVAVEAHQEAVEVVDESPVLEVMESDLIDSDEGEYRTRMKILWLVILVVLVALLAYIVTRPSTDEVTPVPTTGPTAPVSAVDQPADPGGEAGAQPAESPEEPSEEAVDTRDGSVGTATDDVAAREQRLRQELEAEKRQLQAEISRTQGNRQTSDSEEDGGGA